MASSGPEPKKRRSVVDEEQKEDKRVPRPLVTGDELAAMLERQGDNPLHLIDCTWYLPTLGRDAEREFCKAHIRGATFFDIDRVANTEDPLLPHMLPSAEAFAAAMQARNIGKHDLVCVYDRSGIFTAAARMWWELRVFGAGQQQVMVLNESFEAFRARHPDLVCAGPALQCTCGDRVRKPAQPWEPVLCDGLLVTLEQMKAVSDAWLRGGAKRQALPQVLDVRSWRRFMAVEPEPRQVARRGRVPSAVHLAHTDLIQTVAGLKGKPQAIEDFAQRMRPTGQLRAALRLARQPNGALIPLEPERKGLIIYCGSGVTAATVALALACLGHWDKVKVFDGSWAQWGNAPLQDAPLDTGGIPVKPLFCLASAPSARAWRILEVKRKDRAGEKDKSKVFFWMLLRPGSAEPEPLEFRSMAKAEDGSGAQSRVFAQGRLEWNDVSGAGSFQMTAGPERKAIPLTVQKPQVADLASVQAWLALKDHPVR